MSVMKLRYTGWNTMMQIQETFHWLSCNITGLPNLILGNSIWNKKSLFSDQTDHTHRVPDPVHCPVKNRWISERGLGKGSIHPGIIWEENLGLIS